MKLTMSSALLYVPYFFYYAGGHLSLRRNCTHSSRDSTRNWKRHSTPSSTFRYAFGWNFVAATYTHGTRALACTCLWKSCKLALMLPFPLKLLLEYVTIYTVRLPKYSTLSISSKFDGNRGSGYNKASLLLKCTCSLM